MNQSQKHSYHCGWRRSSSGLVRGTTTIWHKCHDLMGSILTTSKWRQIILNLLATRASLDVAKIKAMAMTARTTITKSPIVANLVVGSIHKRLKFDLTQVKVREWTKDSAGLFLGAALFTHASCWTTTITAIMVCWYLWCYLLAVVFSDQSETGRNEHAGQALPTRRRQVLFHSTGLAESTSIQRVCFFMVLGLKSRLDTRKQGKCNGSVSPPSMPCQQ